MNLKKECRPVLRYVEFHAADQCNLKCLACSHFAPLFKHCDMPHREEITRSFQHLARLFRYVETIRILGGEPLLNPELPEIISDIRTLMPQSQLSIVTNGLLLSRWGKELAKLFVKKCVSLYVTVYPVNREVIQKGIYLFASEGVKIILSPIMSKFRLFLTKDRSDIGGYKRCNLKNCSFLRRGRLYICALSALIYQYNSVFSAHYPEETGIILDQSETGEQVLRALKEPTLLCHHCYDCDRLIEWCQIKTPKAENWLEYP